MINKKTKKTVKKAVKKSVKKAVKKSVKKTVKKSVKKAVKKTVKKTVKKAVKKSVKKTVKKSVKKAAKKKVSLSPRKKVLQRIKQGLLSQKYVLLKEAEVALNLLPSEINFPDMGDQATAETDRNFMLRLRDRERMLLKKIEEAIENINNNTYGICDECGSQIGTKRLEARPVTDLCIECKIRQEEEERITEG